MANVTKVELDAIYSNLESLEKDKKEISDEISEKIASFASSHDLDKKSFKKFLKDYKEYLKDHDEFVQTDLLSDSLLITACPELAPN